MSSEQTMIARDMLKPGDHIYRYGKGSSYTHHGIYVGEEKVIHYTRTEQDGGEVISTISSTASNYNSDSNPCPKCNFKSDLDRGVVETCLDCFLSGQNHIYLYKYGLSESQMLPGPNPGGTPVQSRPPSQVVNVASHLLRTSGFGNYNLFFRNCEVFAYYCKTGLRGSRQVEFIMFYMMTIFFLLAIMPLVARSVKFVFKMFSLSLLEFDIRVLLFALFASIKLLEILSLFFNFFLNAIYALTIFDTLAISSKHFEFVIYVTSSLICIKSWLESKLFSLVISNIFVLLNLFAMSELFSLAIYTIILFKSNIIAIDTIFETGTIIYLLTYLQKELYFFSFRIFDDIIAYSLAYSLSPENDIIASASSTLEHAFFRDALIDEEPKFNLLVSIITPIITPILEKIVIKLSDP